MKLKILLILIVINLNIIAEHQIFSEMGWPRTRNGKVKKYLNKNLDVNIKDRNGTPLLTDAIYHKQMDLVEYLLKNGVDVNQQSKNKNTAIVQAMKKADFKLVKKLIKMGSKLNIRNSYGETLLSVSSRYNDLNQFKYLINQGCNMAYNNKSSEVLEEAVIYNSYKIVNYILNKGVINKKYRKEVYGSLLIVCAKKNAYESAELLIKYGADVDYQNEDLNSPLMEAAMNQNYLDKGPNFPSSDIAELLLKSGANPDLSNSSEMTALMYAAIHKKPKVIKLLLEYGANPYLKDDDNRTALSLVKGDGFPDIEEIIKKYEKIYLDM